MTANSIGKPSQLLIRQNLKGIREKFWDWSRKNSSNCVWLFLEEQELDYRDFSEILHREIALRGDYPNILQVREKMSRLQDIVLLWNKGLSANEIIEKTGRSLCTIRQGIRKALEMGMTERPYDCERKNPREKYSKEFIAEVLHRKDVLGETQGEVAAFCAKQLGRKFTSAMIASIVHRGRLARGEPTNKRPVAKERPVKDTMVMIKRVVAPKLETNAAKDYTDPHLGKALKVGIIDLSASHCRAIVGSDERGYPLFCGRQRKDGSAYCADHHKLFHRSSNDHHKQVQPSGSYRRGS